MTHLPEIWDCSLGNLPKRRWVALDDIYTLIERNLTLDTEDYEWQSPNSEIPKWKRNVRAMRDALEMLTYGQKHCPTKQSSGRLSAAVDFCVRITKGTTMKPIPRIAWLGSCLAVLFVLTTAGCGQQRPGWDTAAGVLMSPSADAGVPEAIKAVEVAVPPRTMQGTGLAGAMGGVTLRLSELGCTTCCCRCRSSPTARLPSSTV